MNSHQRKYRLATVLPFRQREAIDDPLSELAREGARPMLAQVLIGDGALGFWKAIEQIFPSTRHQRCWVHKTANVLNKVALSVQVNMKVDLREIYGARAAG